MMSPKDLFGVVVRAVAFYFIAVSLRGMLGAFYPAEGTLPREYVLRSLGMFGLGAVILAAASPIVDFSYRENKPYEDEDDDGQSKEEFKSH